MTDGITELAKMFKERNPKEWLGIQTGIVINEFPNIQIRLNEFVILDKDKLLFASHLMNGYKRDYTASTGTEIGTITGTLEWTDTLKVDDQVILIPTSNEQKYYVIDKVEVV